MKKYWKYLKFLIPSAIVIVLTLIIYAIKGIYPFGTLTVAHADMGQSYETFYHLLWDAIRNGKSILYSYVLGSGSNVFGGFLLDGFASPLAWIIALFKRENIKFAFSFLLIIKMALIALTTYIFFNKVYKNNDKDSEFWKITFSVMYAMGSYVLINYTNIMWLDIVILFPLFCLAIYRLFNENKSGMFILILTLSLIISYYISYMILFFILSCIPFGIIFYVKKEDRKRIAGKVIIAVLISLFLSMFSFLPAFLQTMTSYRMAGSTTNTVTNENFGMKLIALLFSSTALLGTLKLCKHFKEDSNVKMLLLSLLVSGILPIFFERINLLWHTGSYNCFPFRYGFIPTFILMNSGLYYFYKYYKDDYKEKLGKLEISYIIIAVVCAITVVALLYVLIPAINRNNPAFVIAYDACFCMIVIVISYMIILETMLKSNNEKLKKIIVILVVISEIIAYGLSYIGVPVEYRGGTEHSDDTITTANEILKEFDIDENELYRYRDTEMLMTENYPLITNTPSMSTFLHVITEEQAKTHKQLGYTSSYTKLGDAGGTVLSDALLNVKYLLSKQELDTSVLDYKGNTGEIKLYQYKNVLPYGIIYKNDNDISKIPEEYNPYEAQNYMYKQLFDSEQNIIQTIDAVKTNLNTSEENEDIQLNKYELEVKDKSYLYLYTTNTFIGNIKINGKEINIPNMNDYNNKFYPVKFNNGILNLGIYENEKLEIECNQMNNQGKIYFATISIEDYNNIFKNNDESTPTVTIKDNKINIKYNSTENGQKIFLPITYDKGWTGTNNGENIEINRVFNTYISLDLKEGENNIELTFIPANMIMGIKLSLITLAIVLIYTFLIKRFIKKDSILDKIIVNIGFVAYIIITVAFYFKVYIVSIIKTFLKP